MLKQQVVYIMSFVLEKLLWYRHRGSIQLNPLHLHWKNHYDDCHNMSYHCHRPHWFHSLSWAQKIFSVPLLYTIYLTIAVKDNNESFVIYWAQNTKFNPFSFCFTIVFVCFVKSRVLFTFSIKKLDFNFAIDKSNK